MKLWHRILSAAAAMLVFGVAGNAQSRMTASIDTVDVKSLKNKSGMLSTNLAGRIPGLMVSQGSGRPGEGAALWLRGKNLSEMHDEPLVLVDGVEQDINLLNVHDIESIEVLKDAAATVLYGIRGANGVIRISTRQGYESAPKVAANVQYGALQPIMLNEMASTEQWISYYNSLYTQTGAAAPFTPELTGHYLNGDMPDRYPSVDWVDNSFKSMASTINANVNVTGGSRRVHYYVSGSYYNEGGIFNVDRANQYNSQLGYNAFDFLSNLDVNLSNSTNLNFGISTQYATTNSSVSSVGTIMSNILKCTPVATPVRFSDGTLAQPRDYEGVNPYNDINTLGYTRQAAMHAQAHLTLTQDFSEIITQGLKLAVNFTLGTTNGNTISRYRNPLIYYISPDTPYAADGSLNLFPRNNGSNYITLGKSVASKTIITLDVPLTYNRTFGGHTVEAMVLGTLKYQTENVPSNYVYAYPYKYMALGGRVGYSFRNRYFIDFAASYNGTENFERGLRYEFHPAVSAAWNIAEEPFWEDIKDVVSTFRLKGSYGRVGSDFTGSSSRRYVFNSTLSTWASGGTFGTTGQNSPGGITTWYEGYPDLIMENSRIANAGLELQLFNELTLAAEFYSKKSEGIFIADLGTPAVAGKTTQYKNVGAVDNKGIELSLRYDHHFSEDFRIGAYGVYTLNRSTVVDDAFPEQLESYQNHAGYRLNQHFGLEAIGLFKDEADIAASPVQKFGAVYPGDIKYRDRNGDKVIDAYDMDAIGTSATPEVNYGFGVDLDFKGFDFALHFAGAACVSRIISGTMLRGGSANDLVVGQIYEDVALNRWTLENPDQSAEYPRMYIGGSANNSMASTWWLRDMSYLRLRNIDLGYTFRKQGIRIYASVVNPFTISKFRLWDPSHDTDSGVNYPSMRTVLLGLNLQF